MSLLSMRCFFHLAQELWDRSGINDAALDSLPCLPLHCILSAGKQSPQVHQKKIIQLHLFFQLFNVSLSC